MPKAPGPVDIHTFQVLLGVSAAVEADGAKETRQAEQVVSMQVGDENFGDSTCIDRTGQGSQQEGEHAGLKIEVKNVHFMTITYLCHI